MPRIQHYPTDHNPTIDVRSAHGRYEDFAAVVGTQRADAAGCWCMAYRDSRVAAQERSSHMKVLCATEPGPGVLVYVDDIVAGWCSIAPRADHRRLLNSRHASRYGAEVVEGYPVESGGGRVDVISGYVVTVALFEQAGFERTAPTTGRSGGQPRWVLRKSLR